MVGGGLLLRELRIAIGQALQFGSLLGRAFSDGAHRQPVGKRPEMISEGVLVSLSHVGPCATGLRTSDDKKLGKVHFETSCKPEAQKLFDRGMLYQHSFWYRASQKVFEDVLKADPECGIAYWGIALSLLWNPHVPPPAKNLAEGAAAIAKGKSVGAKTQRERDYIDALAVMYADYDKVDHRTRIAGLCQGHGAAGAALSKGRRGADPLRACAQHVGFAGRQDLRQPAQGCGDPGADLRNASRSIRAWRTI